ncbi:hypothetical protein EJB05_28885, partial [Eragrostis curvula]
MARKPSHVGTVSRAAEAKERKGLWSPEEDERLYTQITRYGVSTWSSVAQLAECTIAATAAAPLPVPARFPVFACQLLDGGGLCTSASHQQSSRLVESEEANGGVGCEDDAHYTGCGDSEIIHNFLAFHECDYPDDLLIDVPGVMDAWESELCSSANSTSWLN